MRDRIQGAAAGGGLGAVGMIVQAAQQYAEDVRRTAVEAASQESMVELLKVLAEKCGGG